MKRLAARGLYAVADTVTLARRGLDVVSFAEAVLSAGPLAFQLRAKDLDARETLALLRRLVPLARAHGVPLFANDRADLAVLAGCDGVHVGQSDLPVALARRIAGGLAVGVSTHDEAQAMAALADEPDYLAFGPVFPTESKERPDAVVGLDALRLLAARVDRPLVAIGGLSLAVAPEIAAAGAIGAVIGALVPPEATLAEVHERAVALVRAFRGTS